MSECVLSFILFMLHESLTLIADTRIETCQLFEGSEMSASILK